MLRKSKKTKTVFQSVTYIIIQHGLVAHARPDDLAALAEHAPFIVEGRRR